MFFEMKFNNFNFMCFLGFILLFGLIGNYLEVYKWDYNLWEEMKIE